MNVTIYAIKDPSTKEVVYVGRTTKTLESRLANHIQHKGSPEKYYWIQAILAANYIPLIEEIETVTIKDAPKREAYWIGYYTNIGGRLFNKPVGGAGRNQGRHMKYDEELVTVGVRVPVSKINDYKAFTKDYLQQFVPPKG